MRVVFDGSIVDMHVTTDCKVSAAAALIGLHLSVPGQVQLSFNECVLNSTHSLSDYGIKDDSVLMAVFPIPCSVTFITVSVRMLSGDTYPVSVRTESDICDMFCLCAIAVGQSLQNLSFIIDGEMWTGRYLESQGNHGMRFGQSVSEYGITEGTVITGIV